MTRRQRESTRGGGEGRELGMTLIETVLAMAIMMTVVTSVCGAVEVISSQMTTLGVSTQAIDTLQVAEQKIVAAVHAAAPAKPATTPWCYGAGASPSATPSTELVFTADIGGSITAYDIKISGGNLTIRTSPQSLVAGQGLCKGPWSGAQVFATSLTAASMFTVSGCGTAACAGLPTAAPASWTGGSGATYAFYPSLGLTLTMNSGHKITTTVSDDTVDIWNVEELCQADWQIDPQVSPAMGDPC
jgi:hypothetical protein